MTKHILTAFAVFALSVCLSAGASAQTAPALSPLALPASQVAPPADPAHFTFIVGGDNRPPGQGDPMPPSLEEICREIGWIRPDFVIWTGDAIYGYEDTPAQAADEYDAFLASAALCETPIYAIPGNHELGTSPDLAPVYQQKMGALYGSFDYGNSHFIGLDSTPVVDGKIDEGDIDPAQWQWLESDLAAHAGKSANIFVFFHHYVFGPPDPDDPTGPDTGLKSVAFRDRLHKLFVKYGVRAVFNGHAHLYYHTVRDGIDYYIAGNAGAPMDAPPDKGGYLGYMLVKVDGSKVTAEPLPAWDLSVRDMEPAAAGGLEQIAVDNSNFYPLDLKGITEVVPAGSYTVTASATNKAKTKSVPAAILSTMPLPGGATETLTIEADAPHARTTIITLAPAGQTSAK